jgi:hypothetical protein
MLNGVEVPAKKFEDSMGPLTELLVCPDWGFLISAC